VALTVGLPVKGVLTASEMDELHDEALWNVAERTTLFVEVDPNQKERIILALRRLGHVVGYMGDGINDAPALHDADIGISVNQAVDVAKYVAWKRGMKLVLIPTIISTNAFATPNAGLRKKGKVEYLGEARVDRLVIDYRLIKTAPKGLNVSGVGDILSCHTACFDWKLAWEHGGEALRYDEKTEKRSLALVEKIDANVEAIRDVTNEGIRTLVECELEIVDICVGPGGPGHFRSEEGSEHFFFYNVEHRTGRGFIHGWIARYLSTV
jgi:glycerol dehydrogenase-like iron-containing ADH family enzyme